MSNEDHDDAPPDRYPRTRGPVTLGSAAGMSLVDLESKLGDDPESLAFWKRRDAEVAAQKAADAAVATRNAAQLRALLLKSLECRFPILAVNAAIVGDRTSAIGHAESFLASQRTILVLAGGTGCGKTTAASWLALRTASSPLFVRASELEARGRYDKTLRAELYSRAMLVIDDLGAEALDGNGNFRSLLDEVIDVFYGDGKRIVITTNLRKQRKPPKLDAEGRAIASGEEPQLTERYGERIISRLISHGTWGSCGNHDLRRDQR